MFWVWLVLIIVLVAAVTAVVVGRREAMARAYPDRSDLRMPAGRRLEAEDLEDVEFSVVPRGYRMDEVDELLRRLARELGEREAPVGSAEGGPDVHSACDASTGGEAASTHEASTHGASTHGAATHRAPGAHEALATDEEGRGHGLARGSGDGAGDGAGGVPGQESSGQPGPGS